MARIVVASAAYLGDVAPFVGPANALVDRGHDVTFLAPEGFRGHLNGERFEFAPYALDFSPAAMHADPVHQRLMRHPVANQLRLARYWMRQGFVCDPERGKASLLQELDGADVVVTHPTFGSAVAPAAEHLGVPLVVGQLFPMMIPTDRWTPPLPTRAWDLGPTVNRAVWQGFAWGSGRLMFDREMNRYRASLGVPRLTGTALLSWTSAVTTVVLVSRHYFGDPPPDWHAFPLAGFSWWDGPRDASIDPALSGFVDAGDPPVLVCLGTSAATDAGAAFARIADDLACRGLRSLLLVGDARNLQALAGRPGAFTFAPVRPLLPRCRVAVVSGALGTLAAALAAGVPVVVLPQLFDQLWHGRRVEQLGVGLAVRRPGQVAAAVARIDADPAFAERARALASKLAGEDGCGALVDAVEAAL